MKKSLQRQNIGIQNKNVTVSLNQKEIKSCHKEILREIQEGSNQDLKATLKRVCKDVDLYRIATPEDVLNGYDGEGKSLLNKAIETKASKSKIKILIDNGCKIQNKDQKQNTPLIIAASSGQDEIIKLLIDETKKRSTKFPFIKVDYEFINQIDSMRHTALDWTISNNHISTQNLLIANKAKTAQQLIMDRADITTIKPSNASSLENRISKSRR